MSNNFTARRKFWEMCASRQPQCIFVEIGDSGTHYFTVEDSNSMAQWADRMLAEWDKRWVVNATDDDDDNDIQANEVLP